MENYKEQIRLFLTRTIRRDHLLDDDNIFDQGFVESLFAMQLVLFLEKEFQITIENEDLEIENFSTINAMARLIERKAVYEL